MAYYNILASAPHRFYDRYQGVAGANPWNVEHDAVANIPGPEKNWKNAWKDNIDRALHDHIIEDPSNPIDAVRLFAVKDDRSKACAYERRQLRDTFGIKMRDNDATATVYSLVPNHEDELTRFAREQAGYRHADRPPTNGSRKGVGAGRGYHWEQREVPIQYNVVSGRSAGQYTRYMGGY